VMESLDSGKTIYDCETVDIPETIHVIKWHGELIDKIYDQVSPASNDHIAMIVREPVGVVGLVLPWNFPLLMLAWKIGPALAAGCSVVVKPAQETSLTALRLAEIASEAGLPRGVLNIVTGGGEVGEAVGRHSDVDMVSFTGSTVTGRKFLHYSADSNLKEIVLELGGKNPCIVLDDAEDLDAVAAHVVNGAFWNMGQNCSAASRLIVQRGVKDRLLAKVAEHAREWVVGDPLNPEVRVGALISKAHFAKVSGYLKAAAKEKIVMGGEVVAEGFIEPTVVEAEASSSLAVEEIFGPILTVITVGSFEEAIAVANDTAYGLAASIFTANGKRALRGARMLRAGTVTVNSFGEGDITTPFGGYKQSGFGGRDNSIHAHDQYTQLKTIWLDLTDTADTAID
jgi:gamma-glutamyl-gamma-aminobutyraldehyde dehydrogenase